MKEIDFLPEWYRSGRRRQVGHHTQYIVLGGIFLMMVVWNLIATNSISRATAQLSQQIREQSNAESASQEFARVEAQLGKLQEKAGVLNRIDSRIDVGGVLAELSFMMGERTALSKVEFIAEKFSEQRMSGTGTLLPVAVAGANLAGGKELWIGDVRFRVLINGVAPDGGDVAELICRMEESPYFCQVIPSFSRNRQVRGGGGRAEENLRVTEFEIGCYLANYAEFVER